MENRLVPEVLQMIGQVIPDGVSIAISDGVQYIYYQPSTSIDLKIVPGDQVRIGSATHKALEVREKVTHHVESRVFGVPYYGVSLPLVRQGQIEGCITAIYSKQMMPVALPQPRLSFLIGRGEDGWVPLALDDITHISSEEALTRGGHTPHVLEKEAALSR